MDHQGHCNLDYVIAIGSNPLFGSNIVSQLSDPFEHPNAISAEVSKTRLED